ncbi:Exodeoxyribonuclease III [Methylobacterium gnaphalii]|uniref:Exodeoxyribonuclease III n=1 Tax=Methylobacterium gnaphalii TaxID=1010610 RepID=A0A512JRW2_9HYPH|nr:exodeoxyribonuclease III [Methylobacterium gnaphalii]GJD71502.1 Exodeoxyribonuclease III [Methylobacterium gnaphalii]GLS47198.1 exodeoxyribonuclease III [Methylobacterium gnaphalii]
MTPFDDANPIGPDPLRLTVTTWNINSVRLRIDSVLRFLAAAKPDVLCLQETKCPDDAFPLKALRGSGYENVEFAGQKGYNGVAILSRFPLVTRTVMPFCERQDARHISAVLGPEAGKAAGIVLHDFYVPAGGDIPDRALNPKFAHKLDFLQELRAWGSKRVTGPAILVGDLNVAPLEHDVWSHKQLLDVVSHTPIETEAFETLRGEAEWVDTARHLTPEPEKIYTWWSYRSPDWQAANKGRRLDHAWVSSDLKDTVRKVEVFRDARGWERPSDHVPVTLTLEL